MRKLLPLLLLLAPGCSRAHIRTYDLKPEAHVVLQDEFHVTRPVEIGDQLLISSDKDALIVIEDVRQTRYPLRKGWTIKRDGDCLTIEEIPNFRPY